MICIQKISKKYGDTQALQNISLQLEQGKVYGFVGKNGAGKTTLFRCIARLESYEGIIESKYKPLKNHIGFLETNPVFMSRITGWEYLKLLCVARNIKRDDFDDQNIFELPLNRYAETYSTGMKKKLALLGILLQKNDVFILDEPFNGVDIQSNILILELIKTLKKQDKTILISSHIFSTLSDTCDQIFHMEEGEIHSSYTPESFTKLESKMKQYIIGDKLTNLDL